MKKEILQRAYGLLTRWSSFAESRWWSCRHRPELGCFGTGYNSWGVQTNQKYIGALAVLAAPGAGVSNPDWDTEALLQRVKQALAFSLATHHTGNYHCLDGTSWGRTWISPLGLERLFHGVHRLGMRLPQELRERLADVVRDEADSRLEDTVKGTPWNHQGGNKPESNIWNGAICARAALYHPDHPHREAWEERALTYWINGISVAADADERRVVSGRPISERHVGANFFPHYALDHHGYLNVGYMVICLSNLAMMHYGYADHGVEAPEALYHHAHDLWGVVKRLLFADGRLVRIGGDTRVRYCYCQDYILPTLVFAADHWGDSDAVSLMANAIETVRVEQEDGGDGSFHGRRLAEMAQTSEYYYTRIESDTAVVLAMVIDWLERHAGGADEAAGGGFEANVAGGWMEPEHGAVFHRCPSRFASWSWRAYDCPQGLCLPPSSGHLAEWYENLAGGVEVAQAQGRRLVQESHTTAFDGGFATVGRVLDGAGRRLNEGFYCEEGCVPHGLAFVALPDGQTAVQLERAAIEAEERIYLKGVCGCKLEVPNDLFNGRERTYHGASGVSVLPLHQGQERAVPLATRWVNVDDRLGLLGLYGAEEWTVWQRGRLIGGSPHSHPSITTDALCFGFRREDWSEEGPVILQDSAVALVSSQAHGETASWASSEDNRRLAASCADVRVVQVSGQDGRCYAVAVNFGPAPAAWPRPAEWGSWCSVGCAPEATSVSSEAVSLAPLSVAVLRREG